ncbi:unnamed protein product [Caenorhabditis brenneri]
MASTEEIPVIDPHDYCDFICRGEGQANVVIGAKHKETGVRCVWRIGKIRKTRYISVQPNCEIIGDYMKKIITPLLGSRYLSEMKLVKFDIMDVQNLGKLVRMPENTLIKDFEFFTKVSPNVSALRLMDILNMENGDYRQNADSDYLVAFQMIDATELPPVVMSGTLNPIITIEIKPKQGFYQQHEGIDINLCQTCIYTMEKVYDQEKFSRLSHFCPIRLYSGDYVQTVATLSALFMEPHRNLKIFMNGNVIHSDEIHIKDEDMTKKLFPNGNAEKDDLIQALAFLLTDSTSIENFNLHPKSVLYRIVNAQKIDEIGLIKAHEIYDKLSPDEQEQFMDKKRLSDIGLEAIVGEPSSENSGIHALNKYFLAATIKDCSVMISLRLLNNLPSGKVDSMIKLTNGKMFQYTTKIVDLDPKDARNLTSGYKRFIAGARLYKEHYEEINAQGYHFNCNI